MNRSERVEAAAERASAVLLLAAGAAAVAAKLAALWIIFATSAGPLFLFVS